MECLKEEEDINTWANEKFIHEAEKRGTVYSIKGFERAWNNGEVDYCDFTYMRILEV
jgi:hypothetical protein